MIAILNSNKIHRGISFSGQRIMTPLLLLLVISLISTLSINTAYAQISDAEVNSLLEEIEVSNRTRKIYRIEDGSEIGEISYDAKFDIVGGNGVWRYIEFTRPSVLGWVSSDFVKIKGQTAQVSVDSLNMRQSPSVNSSVLLGLSRGYKSRFFQRKDGFLEIFAPKTYQVAILLEDTQPPVNGSAESNSPVLTIQSTNSESPSNVVNSDVDLEQDTTSVEAINVIESSNVIEASPERLHVIAPGDAISLLVFGETDLSIENVRVPQSGKVSLPLIGSVLVAGRTIPEVEESVASLLSEGYVKNPRLSVTMFSYRPIFIRGAVQETGSFPFSEGLTVGKAIALAGGSKKSAKESGVSVLREGSVVHQGLPIDSVIEISSGDVITVDEELGVQDDEAAYIYLHGEVASPGEYEFRRGLTVEKAIVLAGGFTLRSSRRKISITRYLNKRADEEPEKMKKVKLHTPIQPGDIINVGASWF